MRPFNPISLADLSLSRLLLAGSDGLTKSALKDTIKPLISHRFSGSALTEQVVQALADLSEQGHVQFVGRARYRITDAGQQQALTRLRLTTLPPRLQWKTLKNIDWIAYALYLPPLTAETRKRLGDADGLRAAILKYCFELPTADFSTLTQARNTLLWQQLCDPAVAQRLQTQLPQLRRKAFDQGTVMAALLNDLLPAAKPLDWGQAVKQLVAKAIQARQTRPDELRLAILQQALFSTEADPAPVQKAISASSSDSSSNLAANVSLETFAQAVLAAAQATPTGRFGKHKVFISEVWQTLQAQQPTWQLTLEAFKQRLVEANRQRLITLSRADLAYALDPDQVATSEITHLNSTFHFIRLD